MNINRSKFTGEIIYPDTDGQPMAENTLQFQWIVTIQGGLAATFAHDANVFIAGDLFWYPVEGRPDIRAAPDILVVFGRPRGHRLSYMQWKEGGIAPQVVFEVWSPGNRLGEMQQKFQFYEDHEVEEYYVFDPDRNTLAGFRRSGNRLVEIPVMQGWVSPLLGIRFEMGPDGLVIYGPDGRRFLTYLELAEQREREEKAKEQAQKEKEQVQKRLEKAEREREAARLQADKLAAKLKAMGIDPEA